MSGLIGRKPAWILGFRGVEAADCKSVYAGSIPTPASNKINELQRHCSFTLVKG